MAKLIPMAKKANPRKARLDWKQFEAFMDSLTKESDRGAVLISAALLDDLLERSIRSLLLDQSITDELFGNDRSLGSTGSKMRVAFALGILSESEYQECERMIRVRNTFAHEVSCTFETQKVKDICLNFELGLKPESIKTVEPRGRFFTSALILLSTLWRRPSEVSKRRLKYVETK